MRSLLSPEMRAIDTKVAAGRRLTRAEGLALMASNDLLALGTLADKARRLRAGDDVYFNNNGHINYSNVCVLSCRFCGYGQRQDSPTAYTMSLEEIVARADAFAAAGARELHIVGGLHPDLPLDHYEEMLRRLKARHPQIQLKAFTAVEIDYFSQISGLSLEEVLRRLMAAGLDTLPGGGAEIFAERVRRQICRPKTDGERWLEVHRTAHRLGLKSNATMLFGHLETAQERVDHLLALRDLQDETGGFQCFVPLAFHPENTPLGDLRGLPGPTGFDVLRVMAVSRLFLDNFRNIKAYWIMLTPKMAQLALAFGANDLDGTVREEKIYHAVGSTSPQAQATEELAFYIEQLGRRPVERDSLYNPLGSLDTPVAVRG